MKKKLTKSEIKVIKDFMNQKDETKRMRAHQDFIWKLRGIVSLIEYWCIAFSFPIALLIWLVTGDYWKGLTFWFVVQVYSVSGNLRGLGLHIENLVEWSIKKNI